MLKPLWKSFLASPVAFGVSLGISVGAIATEMPLATVGLKTQTEEDAADGDTLPRRTDGSETELESAAIAQMETRIPASASKFKPSVSDLAEGRVAVVEMPDVSTTITKPANIGEETPADADVLEEVVSYSDDGSSEEGLGQVTLISTSNSLAQTHEPETQLTLAKDLLTQRHQAKNLLTQEPQTQPTPTQEPQTQPTPTQEPQTQPDPTQKPPTKEPRTKKGFYGAISGDARFLNSTTVRPIGVGINFNTGYGLNAALGYKFNNYIRLEGQFSYGTNEIGNVSLPGIPAVTTTTTTPLTIASNITVPTTVNIPGVGSIPAGTVIPTAGTVLNPGTPPTTASAINVAPGVSIPANTPIDLFPGGVPTTGGTTTTTNPGVPPTTVSASGSISTISGLINLYFDFPTGSNLEPYIGGGVGASRASANNLTATYPGTSLTTTLSGTTTVLVYQLMAGLAYYLNPKTAVTLGYRYFNVASQSFNLGSGGTATADGFGVNNIEIGLRFRF